MATATDDDAVREMNARANANGEGPTEEEARAQGKTLEELALEQEQAEAEEKPIPPAQMSLPGTRDKIPRSTGGRAPEEYELRLMGGRRPIVGAFDKGEKLTLLVDATVRAAEDIDIDDDWGNVSKTIRVGKARQTVIRHATPEALMRALVNSGLQRAEATALYDEIAG